MANDWKAEQFLPGGDMPEGAFLIRLSGPDEPLMAPCLVASEVEGQKVMKIIYGDTPLLHFDEFDSADVVAAKKLFIAVAKEMRAKRVPQAKGREVAVKLLRKRLLGNG